MLSEREPKSARIENWPVLILLVIFIAVLLMAICVVGVMLLSEMKETRPTPQQDIPVLLLLTETLPTPTAMQANHYSISFPMIRSGSGSESEQIWKVTKIDNLGYELSGQRYDLATFTRINSQDTAQGYCINPGWDIPDIGTEYVLTAGGTFVPLQESEADPFQRFLKIQ